MNRRSSELRTRLEQVLGSKEAATLMDHLPSDRPATKADLQALKDDGRAFRGCKQRLLAAISGVREDFATQLNAQTRVFVFSTISAVVTLAALTLAFSGA